MMTAMQKIKVAPKGNLEQQALTAPPPQPHERSGIRQRQGEGPKK